MVMMETSHHSRHSLSCRAAATIVNVALRDMGILNYTNMQDEKTVEKERKRVGKKKQYY